MIRGQEGLFAADQTYVNAAADENLGGAVRDPLRLQTVVNATGNPM
jgi:hypothetical protein